MYSLRILDCNSCGEVGATPLDNAAAAADPLGTAGDGNEVVDDEFWKMELVSDVKEDTIPLVRDADDW